jgi:hypothetical protein
MQAFGKGGFNLDATLGCLGTDNCVVKLAPDGKQEVDDTTSSCWASRTVPELELTRWTPDLGPEPAEYALEVADIVGAW